MNIVKTGSWPTIRHRRAASIFLRLGAAMAVLACVLGGDVQRADAAATPPNGLTGTFGEDSNAGEVVPSSGAMSYAIGFELPAARGAAQPSLGLHYASGSGTGEAGEGWGLNLPSIERAPLSGWPKYIDPSPPTVSPASEDRYTYAGQALTFVCVVDGDPACPAMTEPVGKALGPMPAWASGQRHYRLQVEGSFERFFLSSDRQTWTVQRRGGEILEFGAPSSRSRPGLGAGGRDLDLGTSKVFRWNLVRQRDLHADRNLIVYSWEASAPTEREHLRHIHYSPRAGGGASLDDYAYHVELRWELPSYRQVHYTRMDKQRHKRRLQRVAIASKTWSDAASREMVRAYTLTYFGDRTVPFTATEAPLWGRSALESVTQEGACGGVEMSGSLAYPSGCSSLPATIFEYQPATLVTGGVAKRSTVTGSLQGAPVALPQVDVKRQLERRVSRSTIS